MADIVGYLQVNVTEWKNNILEKYKFQGKGIYDLEYAQQSDSCH